MDDAAKGGAKRFGLDVTKVFDNQTEQESAILNFVKDKILDALNAKHFNDALPIELSDVYDKEAYKKSQAYKAVNYNLNTFLIICN